MLRLCTEQLRYLWSNCHAPYVLLSMSFFAIFLAPILAQDALTHGTFIEIAFLIVLLSGAFVVPCGKLLKTVTVIFVILALFFRILHLSDPSNIAITSVNNTLSVTTMTVFVILMVRRFFTKQYSLVSRITAAVTVYLLLGILWARLYEIVDLLDPHSFSVHGMKTPGFIYFSFVTLVTLGYGDIVPLNLVARNLAILEGVIGQLYLVILISSLVSKFSSKDMHEQESRSGSNLPGNSQ